ncbi:MAG TPA: NUDIX domain-containing protein [Armatimonadota bacterium]|jgi:translation initiation factor 2B subunit (eIF-2B alpha/beta/delta family)/ADP-ribose pyrophosphatase YjhB (NUDIX family)
MVYDEDRIPVVTAFVHSDERIALVKRSREVGTYQGKWAGFSGYVEQLPLLQALAELKQEAGLDEDQVNLEGIGVPMRVDDGEDHWLVFPFLFKLVPGAQIRTDCEAEELEWFRPDEVSKLDAVPQLGAAFESVWPGFGTLEFWNGLAEVASDRREGATELARRGMRTLGAYAENNWDQIDMDTLYRAIRAFAASRPSMGVFPNLASRLILGIGGEAGEYNLDELISELLSSIDDAMELSINNARDCLKGVHRLFTLSYSESTRRTIEEWHTEESVVLVGESSPGKEGLYLAEYLRQQGVNIEIVCDNNIRDAVLSSDAVLVGCDSITFDDQIQNKVNTRTAVMTAHKAGIPSYVITQTFKVTPPGWPIFLECQVEDVEAENHVESTEGCRVFDLTPIDAFREIISDEGPLTESRITDIRDLLGSAGLVAVE